MHLKPLKKRDVEPASMREHSASVGSLEHPLLFQLSQIFANRYLAYFEQYSQLLDFDVSFVFEELQNSSSPCFRCHKPIRTLGSTFHRNLDWITVPIFSYPVIMRVINRIDLSDIARQEIQVVGIRTWGFDDRMITFMH